MWTYIIRYGGRRVLQRGKTYAEHPQAGWERYGDCSRRFVAFGDIGGSETQRHLGFCSNSSGDDWRIAAKILVRFGSDYILCSAFRLVADYAGNYEHRGRRCAFSALDHTAGLIFGVKHGGYPNADDPVQHAGRSESGLCALRA